MEEQKNSATFSVTTAGGFNVLITDRENDPKEIKKVIDMVISTDKYLTEKGLKPQVKTSFKPFEKKEKEWTGDKCPQDGGRLYHIKTSTGKDMCKCENGKFDFKTKTSSGCDFVAWGLNLADAKKRQEEWKAKKDKEDFGTEY